MAITIKKSSAGNSFTVTGPDGQFSRYPTGEYQLKQTDGKVFLIDNVRYTKILDGLLPSQVINGDTGLPFADFAALDLYVSTNFFKTVSGSGETDASGNSLSDGYIMTQADKDFLRSLQNTSN